MLNKGVDGAVNLIWNAYEGGIVDSYRVLRGTSADRLELLAEVSGAHTAYTDLTPGTGCISTPWSMTRPIPTNGNR